MPADDTVRIDADLVVVGSGPAAVSAAFPLVEAGIPVLMLDAGDGHRPRPPAGRFRAIRERGREQHEVFVGGAFEGLRDRRSPSPKFRAPINRPVFDGYEDALNLVTDGFTAIGSLASGGLSNVWGAGVSCLDAEDLADWPIDAGDLHASYRAVASRIGVSGASDDDMAAFHGTNLGLQPPVALDAGTQRLLDGYRSASRRARRRGVRVGRARNAVLTEALGRRHACARCAMCVWGCERHAIYSAADDLESLDAMPGFERRTNSWVDALETHGGNPVLRCMDRADGRRFEVVARRVVLACGTIGTARLVLRALGRVDEDVALLASPAHAFALWLPSRLGDAVPDEAFALAQLSFEVRGEGERGRIGFGNLFGTHGLLASDLAGHMPTSRPGARRLLRLLMPSMLLGNCYLSGEYGAHRLRVRADGSLHVAGAHAPALAAAAGDLRTRLAAAFRACGGWMLPGSFRRTAPGEDVHYAGTVPMSAAPRDGQSRPDGEVAGLPGVYVADGAALPSLPCKPPTLTIMANADRIARGLVRDRAR